MCGYVAKFKGQEKQWEKYEVLFSIKYIPDSGFMCKMTEPETKEGLQIFYTSWQWVVRNLES